MWSTCVCTLVKCYIHFSRIKETCGEFIILKVIFISMIIELEMWRRPLDGRQPEAGAVPLYYRNTFSFPFLRYLFCHILAMKTVAMENTQWTQTQLVLWQLLAFTKKIAIFKETMQTDREREGKACKVCWLKFQSMRKALRVINKMAEKNTAIVEELCQFAVTMTRP